MANQQSHLFITFTSKYSDIIPLTVSTMNPFSYLTAAIFAVLILLSILLIVLLYRCYANRNTQDGYWAKQSQQNSDEESQNNKQQILIKQQKINPEIIICDELNYDDCKVSDRKLIDGKLLSAPKDNNVTIMFHTFGQSKTQEPVKKPDNKKLGIMFSIPVIDNFNQSVNVDPEVIQIEDKIDKSSCL